MFERWRQRKAEKVIQQERATLIREAFISSVKAGYVRDKISPQGISTQVTGDLVALAECRKKSVCGDSEIGPDTTMLYFVHDEFGNDRVFYVRSFYSIPAHTGNIVITDIGVIRL